MRAAVKDGPSSMLSSQHILDACFIRSLSITFYHFCHITGANMIFFLIDMITRYVFNVFRFFLLIPPDFIVYSLQCDKPYFCYFYCWHFYRKLKREFFLEFSRSIRLTRRRIIIRQASFKKKIHYSIFGFLTLNVFFSKHESSPQSKLQWWKTKKIQWS